MNVLLSADYDWQINWNRIASANKVDFLQCGSPKERKALKALADTRLISGQGLL